MQVKDFPKFEVLDARLASARSSRIPTSKRRSVLEEQKAQKEDRFLRGRQIAYNMCYHFRLTGAHDIVLDDADLFSITLRNDSVQDFGTRWDEILLSMIKIPSDDVLQSLYKLRIRESDQLKSVLELNNGISSEDIDAQFSEVEDDGEKKHRSETSISKFRRQKRKY